MREVWVAADSIVSPLGYTSIENFNCLSNSISGVKKISDPSLSEKNIAAARISSIPENSETTRFESIAIKAITAVTDKFNLPSDRTLFILSTTKGNISLLDKEQTNHSRLSLYATADFLAKRSGFAKSIVVSNACISGVMALIVAKRFLENGKYDHALVLGADELTRFVVSGFQSLQALSDEQCKPFDVERKGINLGEAAAAILLTAKPDELPVKPVIRIFGAGLSNDANHISGPSRTGEELCSAIKQALNESQIASADVDFISAHGTATIYNDEMESKAFSLAGLRNTPVNSLKGYYGHTLGAAGVLETAISIHCLLNNILIPTIGYSKPGVSQLLNVIQKSESKSLKTFLKTASGFGGCNAAVVLQKI